MAANNTMNMTSSGGSPNNTKDSGSGEYYFNAYVLWGFMSLYLVMFFLGLFNVITLIMIVCFKRMRTVTNVYIFNLSLADLIYILFLPCVVLFQVTQDWTLGPVICKMFHIADSTAKYVSVYFVTILTIDRYLALCHSSWCKIYRTQRLAKYVSIIGWLIIIFPMTPAYMYSGVIDIGSNLSICSFEWPGERQVDELKNGSLIDDYLANDMNATEYYFTLYTFVFCFAIPTIVITFFSFKVLRQLIRASRRAKERLRNRQKQYAYRKVTRLVLMLVVLFVVCWSPVWIMSLIVLLNDYYITFWYFRIAFNAVHALPYLNCAMNPIVYALLTEPFKKILRDKFVSFHYSISSIAHWPSLKKQKAAAQEKDCADANKMELEARSSLEQKKSCLHCGPVCLVTNFAKSSPLYNNYGGDQEMANARECPKHFQGNMSPKPNSPLVPKLDFTSCADSCCVEESIVCTKESTKSGDH